MVKLVGEGAEKVGIRIVGSAGALERRDPATDRAPPGLNRDVEDDGSEEIELPGDSNIHVDGETGAAVIESPDGGVVIDFSGRDTSRERRKRPTRTGFDANLAEDDRVPVSTIASRLLEGIDSDIRARQEWEDTGNKGADMLGVKWEEATIDVSPEGSISKAHHPMLLEAVLRSWANSRAELLPASGPVKVRDDMPPGAEEGAPGIGDNGGPPLDDDEGGDAGAGIGAAPASPGAPPMPPSMPAGRRLRSEKADALERDMNHNLTVVDRGYYSDFSRMLMAKAFKGSQFRKVFFDPITKRPLSRWVTGTDLIISNDGTDLRYCSRVTERSMVQQATVRRMQVMGHWLDIKLGQPSAAPSQTDEKNAETVGIESIERSALPADHRHRIYECHCLCDEGALANDETGDDVGYPLPYRVTIDSDSRQVLEIIRDWKAGDRSYQRRTRYVHYGFVPTIANTYYHWGLVHLMGSSQRAATAMEREFIDSEMLASFPGGVMAKGAATRTDKTVLRGGPGQFDVVETGGEPIANVVMPWPYKGASQQLNVVLEKVVSEARRMAGTLEIPVGEGRVGNVPVGTVMAFVDSISKIPSAVFKDDHISQQEEFILLKELFAEHPECVLSPDKRTWQRQEILDQELVPAADPNTPSYVHRIMQAMAIMEMLKLYAQFPPTAQIPNARAIWVWCLKVLGAENAAEFTMPQQPPSAQPPDLAGAAKMADVQVKQDKNQIERQKLGLKQQDIQRQAASDGVEADQRAADRQSEQQIETTRLGVESLRADRELAHEHAMGIADHAVDLHKHNTSLAHQAAQNSLGLQQEDVHHREQMSRDAGIGAGGEATGKKPAP